MTIQSGKVILPYGINQIPDNYAGTYQFCLRFPSDYELGINSKKSIQSVKQNICQHLCHFQNFGSLIPCSGELTDHRSKHISNVFKVDAQPASILLEDIFEFLAPFKTLDEIKQLTSLLRNILENSNPIYIGIAQKQSIQERILQHVNGYTKFSQTLSKSNLKWENLYLRYYIISGQTESLRAIEKLSQKLLKPTMSIN